MGLRVLQGCWESVSPPQFLEPACSEHVAGSCRPQPAFRQANEVRKDCHSLVQHTVKEHFRSGPCGPGGPASLALCPWPRGPAGAGWAAV